MTTRVTGLREWVPAVLVAAMTFTTGAVAVPAAAEDVEFDEQATAGWTEATVTITTS